MITESTNLLDNIATGHRPSSETRHNNIGTVITVVNRLYLKPCKPFVSSPENRVETLLDYLRFFHITCHN